MSVFPLKFYGQLSNIILSRLASTNKSRSDIQINQRRSGISIFADVAPTGLWSEDRVDILTGEPEPEPEPGPVLVMFAK